MALEITNQLNVDFHDSKYISINAKQYDKKSRFILISCYNQGKFVPIYNNYNEAYIRYRKADDLGVFNSCILTKEGKIIVELTEQMLAVSGRCYADLVIVNNNPIQVTENTGELITDDNDCIVSTMTFSINVIETAFDNTEIESSYEYNALNDLIIKVTEDYTYVMKACKISEENAKESEINAKASEDKANASELNAKTSELNAKTSELNASISETNAKETEGIIVAKANEASQFADAARQYAADAAISENVVVTKTSEASRSAIESKSYAIGGTGTRDGEDSDNAKYYYSRMKTINDGIGGGFLPMGTVKFAQLSSVEKGTGYTYHVSDSFVTDDTFKGGAGISYDAGTNVYYTADGFWDCFITQITVDDVALIQKTIANLQERINNLEEQTVLEIVE